MPKLLVIDDDPVQLTRLQKAFTENGFTVVVAQDGEEGLTKVKEFQPDVISLDMILPKLNGIEVLEKLKSDPTTKNIPVVILSYLDSEKDIEKTLSLGALRYMIKKEYTIEQIIDEIKQVLPTTQTTA